MPKEEVISLPFYAIQMLIVIIFIVYTDDYEIEGIPYLDELDNMDLDGKVCKNTNINKTLFRFCRFH